LAELFQRSHLIEKWGRGIKMILEREPATEFEEVGSALFVARFWRKRLGKDITQKTGVTSEKISEKTSEKILDIIRTNKTVSARQLAEILRLTPRAIEHQIALLRQKGFLKRIGPDKGGHWEVSGD
jgi:ATP-dependent DNA helicase RecG